jgi:GMP synthase-like glutamine amidotransferase
MNSRYRLGLLLCDHAMPHLEPRFGDYPEMFAAAFADVSAALDWQVYDVTAHELPRALGECDGYLVSGSRHGAYDPIAWIPLLEDFLRRAAHARAPTVGLCFGHQIMGQALGGVVQRAEQGWGIGVHAYQVLEHAGWMAPSLDAFVVPVCHQDQVLALPPGARRLARNTHCENFVVHFAPRMLGIQGHPEFSIDFIAALVEWRREVLPATIHSAATASLSLAHDSTAVKRWIMNFLGVPNGH